MRLRKIRGYSLIELIVAIAIFGIVLSLVVVNLRTGKPGVEARGLAELVAEQLRQARQQAIAHRVPVAVVFPSGGGSLGYSQSLYVLEGESKPRITRSINFASEFPDSCIFLGYWPIDAAQLQDPGAPCTIAPALTGSTPTSLLPGSWVNPPSRDFIFLFTPSGTVVTNDQPNFDHAYHLLISDGVVYAQTGPPPGPVTANPAPTYFQPSRVCRPYTVSLTAMGAVATALGVTAVPAGVVQTQDHPIPLGSPALPPDASLGANAPTVLDVKVDSLALPGLLPPGVTATVTSESHLSLAINATDPDGDPLYCKWNAVDSSGADVGGFSSAFEERMEWDAQANVRHLVTQWRSPPGANPGDIFHLTAQVSDKRGGFASLSNGALQDVQLVAKGRILYVAPQGGSFANPLETFVMTGDGAGPRRVIGPATPYNQLARFSPDGSKIVFTSPGGISIMNGDGSCPQSLTTFGGEPSFSPDGTQILFAGGSPRGVFIMNSDGTGVRPLHSDPTVSDSGPVMSADGSQIAFTQFNLPPTYHEIYLMNADGTNLHPLTTNGLPMLADFACWQPNPVLPNQILYTLTNMGSSGNLALINATGGTQVVLTASQPAGNYGAGCFSPDGTQIVYVETQSINSVFQMNTDGSAVKMLRAVLGVTCSWVP